MSPRLASPGFGSPRRPSLGLAPALTLLVATIGAPAISRAEPPPAVPPARAPGDPAAADPGRRREEALPPGVVARVGDRDVTEAALRRALVERARTDLADPKSSSGQILEILIEERVVLQEAGRLGIVVAKADVDGRYAELDAQVRRYSGGRQTLDDVRKGQSVSESEFRLRLEDQVRKERIASHPTNLGARFPTDERARVAQTEVVIRDLLDRSKIVRDGLPATDVARVNGQPITVEELGAAIEVRGGTTQRAEALQRLCVSMLLEREGLAISDADLEAALELERPLWRRAREDALEPALRTISFEAFLQVRYGATLDEMRRLPYWRGLHALKARVRRGVSDDDTMQEWQRGSTKEWGATLLATDITVSYTHPKAIAEPVRRRTQEEARRIAADFARRGRGGERAEALTKEIEAAKDRGMRAVRRRLVHVGDDLLLFDAALAIPDGQWTDPVPRYDEYHVLQRESFTPAPPFEEVKPVVRERVVADRTSQWLLEALRSSVVYALPR